MKRIIFATILFISTGVSFAQEDTDFMRLYEVYSFIDRMYVDEVPRKDISEAAIVAMLEKLDPHSTYIPAEEVEQANERINGSFVGVGIRFNILKDTILVVNPIPGGPSEKLGILAGDKIIAVEGETVAGIGIKNSDVREKLLGEKGSKVNITILRGGSEQIDYVVTRADIPVNSVVSSYMVDKTTGFIKLTNFSKTTDSEVKNEIKRLKKEGMVDLIFDLQGNGGGLLFAAKAVADEFLDKNKLIVYSEGRAQPKSNLNADRKGGFETGRLIILIDESSASASEIVSGAIQDWDRGLLVGRRSYGKGLVQRPIPLSDGSQIRLTIARYFTPSGRFIQKDYEDLEAYRNDYIDRFEHGEMMHRDSIRFDDSLIYKTLLKKRDVYGGGGIMPDVFVPLDTNEYSKMYRNLSRLGVINTFTISYANSHRKSILSKYKTIESFNERFEIDKKFLDEFFEYTAEQDTNFVYSEEDFEISGDLLKVRLKAMLAQNIWDIGAFYQVFNVKNEIFMRGYEALKNGVYEETNLIEE